MICVVCQLCQHLWCVCNTSLGASTDHLRYQVTLEYHVTVTSALGGGFVAAPATTRGGVEDVIAYYIIHIPLYSI